jgi:hypothetical protein
VGSYPVRTSSFSLNRTETECSDWISVETRPVPLAVTVVYWYELETTIYQIRVTSIYYY